VTLEPCSHTGRTGPCSTALTDAGVTRVVVAMRDPNPAAGGGAELLRDAGIDVDVGVLAEEAQAQNAVFLHGLATGRPFVVAKAAVSLDGRIAAADGTSQWLTSEPARLRAHALRAEVDAVVVGSGTVLTDDPALTCRLPGYRGRQPLRVVLDRRGRVRPPRRVLDGAAPTMVLPAADPRGSDPRGALAVLWEHDVRSVLVEGGAEVLGAFLRAGLVDRMQVHVAPLLLGEAGRPLLAGPWAATLGDVPRWRTRAVEHIGDDAILTVETAAVAAPAATAVPPVTQEV
jgi:diaminohydroxyphosphoribosylaminopyrimidine deaminase/5-amino-6-(5-phosphoribosylamino)uracil reductase